MQEKNGTCLSSVDHESRSHIPDCGLPLPVTNFLWLRGPVRYWYSVKRSHQVRYRYRGPFQIGPWLTSCTLSHFPYYSFTRLPSVKKHLNVYSANNGYQLPSTTRVRVFYPSCHTEFSGLQCIWPLFALAGIGRRRQSAAWSPRRVCLRCIQPLFAFQGIGWRHRNPSLWYVLVFCS